MNRKYSRLERKIRKIAPASKYGYLGYLLSPDHQIEIIEIMDKTKLIIRGGFSFNVGYNCVDVNRQLYKLLEDNGIRAKFQIGEDSKQIFKLHYFCRNDENKVIDAAPLFSFYGENHLTQKDISINDPLFSLIDIRSFLTIYQIEQRKTIIEIITKDKSFLIKGVLRFTLGASVIDTMSQVKEAFEVNLRKYRKETSSNDQRCLIETSPEIISKGFNYQQYNKKDDNHLLEKAIQQHYHARNAFVHKMAYCYQE